VPLGKVTWVSPISSVTWGELQPLIRSKSARKHRIPLE